MHPVLTLSVQAAALMSAHRFTSPAGGLPTFKGNTYGVLRHSADVVGQVIPVDVYGVVDVESAGVVAAGSLIETTADGRAAAWTDGQKVARAFTGAALAGQLIQVFLIPN